MVRGGLHGIARYALELAVRLPKLAGPEWKFLALVGPEGLPPDLGPLTPSLPVIRTRGAFLSPLEQPRLAATLWSQRRSFDLFHATSFSLPALWTGALVATLHDANHLALPENYGPGQTAYYRLVVGPRAKRARALITVSEFSRRELEHFLGISAYRFQVIPNGVDARFHPRSPSEVLEFRRRRGLPERYLLAMGSEKAHKNLAILAPVTRELPVRVAVLAGGGGVARRLGFGEDVIDLESVSEDELPLLYASAEALIFPSYYEGFGLPALEAMACGCPVIASNASSLPEVCGQAAVLVEPHSEPAWREAILRLVRDSTLRRELSERGVERAARFSWDDCARQTLAVYQRALERGRP